MLDPINNSGARLICGAFRTSPVSSLLCEANIPSLDHRRKNLILNYITKAASNSSNPVIKLYKNVPIYAEIYKKRKRLTKPLILRAHLMLKKFQDPIPLLKEKLITRFPPWLNYKPKILDILELGFSNEHPLIVNNSLVLELISKYGAIPIYTDGSKKNDNVGCAIITPTQQIQIKLQSFFSVFSSELYAIAEAVNFIKENEGLVFIIFTDCKSAITAISNCMKSNSLAVEIAENIAEVKESGKEIILSWIPSHSEIVENEVADKKAKEAASLQPSTTSSSIITNHSKTQGKLKNSMQKTMRLNGTLLQ